MSAYRCLYSSQNSIVIKQQPCRYIASENVSVAIKRIVGICYNEIKTYIRRKQRFNQSLIDYRQFINLL